MREGSFAEDVSDIVLRDMRINGMLCRLRTVRHKRAAAFETPEAYTTACKM
jgi:hypothetical protein